MKPKLFVNLGVIVILFLITALAVNAAGLGVAPATLRYENALKGATTEKQLTVQNPGDKPILCTITIDGEMDEWIKLAPPGKIEIPAKDEIKITVKLTPPVNKPNGEYNSKVHVRAQGIEDIQGSGMGLLPGVDTDIVAKITDKEIIAGDVYHILTKDEKYGTPITFIIGFENQGNVPVGPDVKIDITKGSTGIIDTIEKTMEKIKTGARKDYEIKWQTHGKEKNVYYRANVIVSLAGKILEEKEGVGFRILGEEPKTTPKKSDSVTGLTTKSKITLSENMIGIIIIIAIVAMGAIAYYVIKKRK